MQVTGDRYRGSSRCTTEKRGRLDHPACPPPAARPAAAAVDHGLVAAVERWGGPPRLPWRVPADTPSSARRYVT
jgi:hypothetical protein